MERESGIFCETKNQRKLFRISNRSNNKIVIISTEGIISTLEINRKKMDILSTTELNDLMSLLQG